MCLYADCYGRRMHSINQQQDQTDSHPGSSRRTQHIQPLDIITLLVPETALQQTLYFTLNIPPTC
jgi:hypothetical protein